MLQALRCWRARARARMRAWCAVQCPDVVCACDRITSLRLVGFHPIGRFRLSGRDIVVFLRHGSDVIAGSVKNAEIVDCYVGLVAEANRYFEHHLR